jgi:hypothetical protein
MGRIQQVGASLAAPHQHLLLLLALELLVVELRGAALVRWEIGGHDGKTPGPRPPFPDKLKGRRAWRDDPPNMVSGWMLQPGRPTGRLSLQLPNEQNRPLC